MRKVVEDICEFAYDAQVSDARFREAIRCLAKPRFRRMGGDKAIKYLRENAIVESERDIIGMGSPIE